MKDIDRDSENMQFGLISSTHIPAELHRVVNPVSRPSFPILPKRHVRGGFRDKISQSLGVKLSYNLLQSEHIFWV